MEKQTREERIEQARVRANDCSDRVVARRQMCAGCHGDAYCNVSQKFNEAYPNNALKTIMEDPRIMGNITVVRLGSIDVD